MVAELLRHKRWIAAGLLFFAAGCFQPAGREVEPTSVDIAILTPEPTATPTLTPTATAFITPLPPEGFIPPSQTPTPLPTQPPEPTATPFEMFPQSPTAEASPEAQLAPTDLPTEAPTEVPILLPPTPTALPPDQPCQHTVQPGEWLTKIARIYNLTDEDFLRANPRLRNNPNSLQPGDVLIVPGCVPRAGSGAPPAESPPDSQPPPPADKPCQHTVQPGEWLAKIARMYNLTNEDFLRANPRLRNNPNSLQPGDVLIVPNCAPRVGGAAPPAAPPAQATAPVDPATLPTPIQLTERVYTVVAGDTLGAIARKFGITVQQLRQANGLLEGDFIRVGQQLKIPAPQ